MESIHAEGSPFMGQGPDSSFEPTVVKKCQEGPASDISLGDALNLQSDIKRDAQGYIDYEFYHQRATRLRSEQFFTVGKAIKRFVTEVKETLAHVCRFSF